MSDRKKNPAHVTRIPSRCMDPYFIAKAAEGSEAFERMFRSKIKQLYPLIKQAEKGEIDQTTFIEEISRIITPQVALSLVMFLEVAPGSIVDLCETVQAFHGLIDVMEKEGIATKMDHQEAKERGFVNDEKDADQSAKIIDFPDPKSGSVH